MSCWNCKHFDYLDYIVDKNGQEHPYGICENKSSKDYGKEVPEGYECNKFEKLND